MLSKCMIVDTNYDKNERTKIKKKTERFHLFDMLKYYSQFNLIAMIIFMINIFQNNIGRRVCVMLDFNG